MAAELRKKNAQVINWMQTKFKMFSSIFTFLPFSFKTKFPKLLKKQCEHLESARTADER